MDIKSEEARSLNMRHIKSKNTKPEMYFRKLLFSKGYRYRVGAKNIPGHPDIFLRKYKAAVFIHGCFWHRHRGCKYAYMPKTRVEFWQRKFDANIKRDSIVMSELKEKKVRCLIIWECTIRKMLKDADFEKQILLHSEEFLHSSRMEQEL